MTSFAPGLDSFPENDPFLSLWNFPPWLPPLIVVLSDKEVLSSDPTIIQQAIANPFVWLTTPAALSLADDDPFVWSLTPAPLSLADDDPDSPCFIADRSVGPAPPSLSSYIGAFPLQHLPHTIVELSPPTNFTTIYCIFRVHPEYIFSILSFSCLLYDLCRDQGKVLMYAVQTVDGHSTDLLS